jgi:hypothetical protein
MGRGRGEGGSVRVNRSSDSRINPATSAGNISEQTLLIERERAWRIVRELSRVPRFENFKETRSWPSCSFDKNNPTRRAC